MATNESNRVHWKRYSLLFLLLLLVSAACALRTPPSSMPATGLIAFIYKGEVWVTDLEAQRGTQITAFGGDIQTFAFSPDGHYLAVYRGEDGVFITPVGGGAAVHIPDPDKSYFTVEGWLHPDVALLGEWVKCPPRVPCPPQMTPVALWQVAPDGTGLEKLVSGESLGFGYVRGDRPWAFSHDGRRVAFVRYGQLMVSDADGENTRPLVDLGPTEALALKWAPKDNQLFYLEISAEGGLETGKLHFEIIAVDVASGAKETLTRLQHTDPFQKYFPWLPVPLGDGRLAYLLSTGGYVYRTGAYGISSSFESGSTSEGRTEAQVVIQTPDGEVETEFPFQGVGDPGDHLGQVFWWLSQEEVLLIEVVHYSVWTGEAIPSSVWLVGLDGTQRQVLEQAVLPVWVPGLALSLEQTLPPEVGTPPMVEEAGAPVPAAFPPPQGEWRFLGPAGVRVGPFALDPSEPGRLFVVAGDGAIYATEDGGSNWDRIESPLLHLWVNGLAIDGGSSDILYAATDRGVYKSEDAGLMWELLPTPKPRVYSVATVPGQPRVVYLGFEYDPEVPPILYKSTDGGDKWREADQGIPRLVPDVGGTSTAGVGERIVLDPTNSQRLYARSVDHLYRTDDGGGVWTELAYPQDWPHLLAADADGKTLYLSVLGPEGSAFYRSPDRGASWEAATLPTSAFTNCMLGDPVRPGWVYVAAEDGVWMSADGATTWENLNLSGPWIHHLAVSADGAILYAGSISEGPNGGVYAYGLR